MRKIKIFFLSIVFILVIISFYFMNKYNCLLNSQINRISEFQVTKISGKGKVYKDSAMTVPIYIKNMKYSSEFTLISDSKTSFEFFFSNTCFIALPNSKVSYRPKIKECYLQKGEFYWNKQIDREKTEVLILSSQNIMTLSNSGRVKITDNSLKVWDYSGNLSFFYKNETYNLRSNQLLIFGKNQGAEKYGILSSPVYISPEKKILFIGKLGDSIVRFKWKNVMGASSYLFRLYSSNLKEDVLYKKVIRDNKIAIDFLKFEDLKEFFWQVFPYDEERKIEGNPSKIGNIKITARLIDKKLALRPPKLYIDSLSVSGNVVLIRGDADVNSQLFVNDEPVSIDSDGKFFYSLFFKSVGKKLIVFRLISPSEVETVIERGVIIFEE